MQVMNMGVTECCPTTHNSYIGDISILINGEIHRCLFEKLLGLEQENVILLLYTWK